MEQFLWTFAFDLYAELMFKYDSVESLKSHTDKDFDYIIFQIWAIFMKIQSHYIVIMDIFGVFLIALNRFNAIVFPFPYEKVY